MHGFPQRTRALAVDNPHLQDAGRPSFGQVLGSESLRSACSSYGPPRTGQTWYRDVLLRLAINPLETRICQASFALNGGVVLVQ